MACAYTHKSRAMKENNGPIQTRRTFLGSLGLAASAAFTAPWPAIDDSGGSRPGIALQLWSVREDIDRDVARTLDKIAHLGFRGVETAFFPENLPPAAAGQLLRNAGLPVVSVHCELPLGEERQRMLDLAEAYRCDRMVWHGWPEDPRYRTADGIRELADLYNGAADFAHAQKLQFGLHNHWWEFTPQADGRLPYDLLLDHLDPGIFFEIDTYWAALAGRDAAQVVGRFGKRAPLLHLKDGPLLPDAPMVALGTGKMDVPAILRASGSNAEWLIVEFDDCATDLYAALKKSLDYLEELNINDK
jgi:sugar phosphate isomerase/epimerase